MGVGEAAWLCAAPACLVGCRPLRGARFGLGPTRRTNGLVLGADGQGIDGLRGATSSNQGGPLPRDLAHRLYESARSEEPSRLYAKFHKRKQHTATIPKQPLLYVPSHTARSVDQDLKSAGIPKQGPGGKIDFHAIRKAYINLVIESGVTVKEAQALARHASPELTMNVYGHAREDRLADAVERVAEVVLPVKRVPVEYQQAVGAETKIATPLKTEDCDNKKWRRRRESNPRTNPL